MNIALDAMGGDHAPEQIVMGALQAAPTLDATILLVGKGTALQPFLPATLPANIELIEASEQVEMQDKPTEAYRTKKDSSLMICTKLVAEGKAAAIVSAGNTGAATTFSLMTWNRIVGVHRPAIASQIPTMNGDFILLDAGASPDIDPEHLVQFAIMGRAYFQTTQGKQNPTVHLLNVGEEEGKGNAFAKACYTLLKPYPWFKGNIEGKTVFTEPCDVVVCDAFVGNIFLKTSEGVAEFITKMIRKQVPTDPVKRLAYLPMRAAMAPLREKMDYASYGGSPLLGVNGICVIGHGRSNAKAIKNALFQAKKMADGNLVSVIREGIDAYQLEQGK